MSKQTDLINIPDAITVDSSENVLVGKATSSGYTNGIELRPYGLLTSSRDGAASLLLNRTTNDGDIISLAKDGATVGSIGSSGGDLIIGTGVTGVHFHDGVGSIIPWSVTASSYVNNSIDLGTASYNYKDAYLSGGVYLGGTTSANKLTDYEQGTWTPVDSGGNTYNTNVTSTYIKIGKLVYIYMDIVSNSNTVANGTNQVAGLPFATATSSNAGTISQGYNTGSGNVTGHMYGTSIYLINGESTAITLNQRLIASGVYHAN